MSVQVGYEDLPCETVHCTPLRWSHCAAGVTVPCTSLGGPILIKNIEPRMCPKFPILILKLVHPTDRNEARLESMAPLLEILEVVDMTNTIACRLGLLSNNDNKGSVRLWGWATPGCVSFTRATGVSKVDQAQFSREGQDTVRVLSGL